ncbi:MAG: sigma-70 family RNA polymerase sigma factor [Ignavibacteriales bacterium]|nr:sigma-70 family RNA polymerase sigma factor [Ignavibacteriales bacterium]
MNDLDFQVIQKVLAGEKRAYAQLVDRHKDKAMALAVRMLKNHQDAEEALQDAFIRAFNALPRFEWKSSFSTWFYRIVYNVCATALSKKGSAQLLSLDGEEGNETFGLLSDIELPDIEFELDEFRQIVQEEINKLPHTYASVLTLFFIQEMSYEEIVETSELPLGTVKNRLFRARTMLRDAVLKRLIEVVRKEKVA